jgi:hypothetical protein
VVTESLFSDKKTSELELPPLFYEVLPPITSTTSSDLLMTESTLSVYFSEMADLSLVPELPRSNSLLEYPHSEARPLDSLSTLSEDGQKQWKSFHEHLPRTPVSMPKMSSARYTRPMPTVSIIVSKQAGIAPPKQSGHWDDD